MKAIIPAFSIALFVPQVVEAQLLVSEAMTPQQLVENVLLGGGLTVTNVTYNGVASPVTPQDGSGSFTLAGGVGLGLEAGVILSSGLASTAAGDAMMINSSDNTNDNDSDDDLEAIVGGEITNGAVLEFDFVPTGDSLKFNYVFASEEYPEFVCSYNDAFGFFLSGPGLNGPYTNNAVNIALVPGTSTPVTIDNVNHGLGNDQDDPGCPAVNPEYYVENDNSDVIVYDGMTVVLTARAQVQCGLTYHIKLAIADAGNGFGDTSYDSGVFLEAGSFTSTGAVIPGLVDNGVNANDTTLFEGCGVIPFHFQRGGDTTNTDTIQIVIGGTATPGVDYYPALPSELIYQPGDTLISYFLTVPDDPDPLETITIHITQNVICSGQQVESDYTFYINEPDPLIVETTDINGVCGQDYVLAPVITGGLGFYHYMWSTGATTSTIEVSPDSTTTYYLVVSDTCNVDAVMDSVVITIPVYPDLTLQVSPDVAIACLANEQISAMPAGGNGDYTYTWTLSGTNVGSTAQITVPYAPQPADYVVVVEEGCGQTATDTVQVSMIPMPPILITAADDTVVCPGDTTILRIQGLTGGNGVYTYLWTDLSGQLLSTGDTLQVPVTADTGYLLTVNDQCTYTADTLVTTWLSDYEPFTLDVTGDTTICIGASIDLWAQVNGGSLLYTINWQGLASNDPHVLLQPEQDAIYRVDVLDRCGWLLQDSVEVIVEHPEANILISNLGEDDWLFQANTYPYQVPVMIWDLGDGTKVKATSATHSYYDLEDHWVYLHMVSDAGCEAMDSLLITPPGTIFMPTGFTPDGDGINDTFGPVGQNIAEFEMSIFDRWGHLVFETEDLNKRWDGKVNGGEDARTGVYVYKYRVKGHYFSANEAYGAVTLVRGAENK